MLISTILVKAGWGNTRMPGNPVLVQEEWFATRSALPVRGREAEGTRKRNPDAPIWLQPELSPTRESHDVQFPWQVCLV